VKGTNVAIEEISTRFRPSRGYSPVCDICQQSHSGAERNVRVHSFIHVFHIQVSRYLASWWVTLMEGWT
jgi:hypothetical protein